MSTINTTTAPTTVGEAFAQYGDPDRAYEAVIGDPTKALRGWVKFVRDYDGTNRAFADAVTGEGGKANAMTLTRLRRVGDLLAAAKEGKVSISLSEAARFANRATVPTMGAAVTALKAGTSLADHVAGLKATARAATDNRGEQTGNGDAAPDTKTGNGDAAPDTKTGNGDAAPKGKGVTLTPDNFAAALAIILAHDGLIVTAGERKRIGDLALKIARTYGAVPTPAAVAPKVRKVS